MALHVCIGMNGEVYFSILPLYCILCTLNAPMQHQYKKNQQNKRFATVLRIKLIIGTVWDTISRETLASTKRPPDGIGEF